MLIKNAKIVNSEKTYIADILIKKSKIVQISENIKAENEQVIDAKNQYVFAGAIDPHVHFSLPTFAGTTADDFLTGSQSALSGGTTTVLDFVTPQKGESLVVALKKRKQEAENSKTNTFFHISPIEWTENTENELKKCVTEFGIKSFKIYTAYKNGIGINDDTIIKVLQAAKKLGVLVMVHCENDEIITHLRQKFIAQGKTSPKYHPISRPDIAEAEAINRIIAYSQITDTQVYIVHISSQKGIELISEAQKKGTKIFAETCPHYLLLNDKVYDQPFYEAAKYVLSPPIRKTADQNALWTAIQNGTIQTIGTDHCSFNLKGQKDLGINDFTRIANGAGGVEHRLSLMFTYGVLAGKITINKMVEICCEKPAQLFGLHSKGWIEVGYDADIVIWNEKAENTISAKNHKQNCDNNIYEGFKTFGFAETVILQGKIV